MSTPTFGPTDVYNYCLQGIKDPSLRDKFIEINLDVASAAIDYLSLAAVGQLFSFVPDSKKNDEVIVGKITKAELKGLYTYYMVESSMPARSIYNQIIASAPSGICPLCGAGYAVTLDHYLPKSKFPMFSVLPHNLIPACRDCNTGKSAQLAATAEEQSFHPYYDHSQLREQWLFANVEHSTPPVIKYIPLAPATWSAINQSRIVSHFESLKLAARFSVLAANELASLRSMLIDYVAPGGPAAIKDYLSARAASELQVSHNSWKAAMFQALSNDKWYCEVGFCL
jgi:5-methylcytosine-specific restriction endonuclease McrA